jgi:uncharacterized protein
MSEEIEGFREEPAAIYDENGNPLADFDKDARNWGMICHLSGALVIFGIPLLHILGPFAVWIWKKNEYSFVDDQGKEALNFQISMGLYGLVGWVLTVVFIGWLIVGILIIANLILVAIASSKARKGEAYRYPFNLRLIR